MLSKIDALTSQYRKVIIQPNCDLAIGNDQQNNAMIWQNFWAEELIEDFTIFCQRPSNSILYFSKRQYYYCG
jgi:hypothetical protein